MWAPQEQTDGLPDRPSRSSSSGLLRLANVFPIAAILIPLSLLALVAWLDWHAVWRAADAELRRASLSAAEYGQRAFESYRVAAGRVNDRLRGLSDDQIRADELTLNRDLNAILRELTQSELAYVIDRDGFPLIATNLYPVPRTSSLADREYFIALRDADAPEVFITNTFVGRFDGKLLFSLGRRRTETGNGLPPGEFDGVVTVSVNPSVLADGLTRLLPTPTDRMAFMRADGFGISTTSGLLDSNQPLPQVAPESPFHEFSGAGVDSAVYISRTAMPGSEALLAMQALDGLPIYAVSLRAQSEIIAAWRARMIPLLGFGLPATFALFLLSMQVSRDQQRLAARNASLQQDNALSNDRLFRAKRFGLVGTFEYDLRTGVSRRSPEYMSVHGLPAVAALETHDDWARRLHPDDRQRAEAEVFRVLSDESGETDYGQSYRIITPGGDIRWIAARGEIERDATGRAVMLRGAHVDVTPLRTTELALAESDARLRLAQEAVGIGAWEWLGSARPLRCSRKFREILGFDLTGEAPRPRTVLANIHPDDRQTMADALRSLRETGNFRVELRMVRPQADRLAQPVWVAVRAKRLASTQLGGARLMGIVYDISDRKQAEELTVLMAHEVEHRAKNALTVVSSLLRMTRAGSAEELAQVMDGRVRALSQTMALLGKSRWKGADLRDIVESELGPFVVSRTGDGFAISITGPAFRIGVEAAQPLSMALHELATNAVKYGALSVPGGSLSVSWTIAGDEVHLRWQERGGPPVEAVPTRAGFGSRLITMLFEGQIGGRITKRWEREGLLCEMVLPIRPDEAAGQAA